MNGNLEYADYYFGRKMCIGSSSVANNKWEPQENENVTIAENICSVNNSCKFDYGRLSHEGIHANGNYVLACSVCFMGLKMFDE